MKTAREILNEQPLGFSKEQEVCVLMAMESYARQEKLSLLKSIIEKANDIKPKDVYFYSKELIMYLESLWEKIQKS